MRDFVEKGREVTVLTGLPNYLECQVFQRYKNDPRHFSCYSGADIVRVPLVPRGKRSIQLALDYVSFCVSASLPGAFKLRRRRFDAIFVYAVSTILAAIPAIILGRLKRAPVFVWGLGLWLETLRAVNVIHKLTRRLAALSPAEREQMGAPGRNYYQQEFARPALLARLERLFSSATLRRS